MERIGRPRFSREQKTIWNRPVLRQELEQRRGGAANRARPAHCEEIYAQAMDKSSSGSLLHPLQPAIRRRSRIPIALQSLAFDFCQSCSILSISGASISTPKAITMVPRAR